MSFVSPKLSASFVGVNDECLMVGHVCDVYVSPFLVDMHDVVYYLRVIFFTIRARLFIFIR